MRILDRYIVRSFVFNYLLALGVLLGMVVLLDLVVNFESFTRAPGAAPLTAFGVLAEIFDYYAYQLLVIFQQVFFAVPLLAAGFTMIRMTRHNELTAMLAAGVSLRRVAFPIVLVSVVFSILLPIANQEFVISNDFIIQKLLRPHGDTGQIVTRDDPLYFVRDQDNSLLLASSYDHKTKTLTDVRVIVRDSSGLPIGRYTAEKAVWKIPDGETTEAWVMINGMRFDDRNIGDPDKNAAEPLQTFTYHTSLTPQQLDLIFSRKAVEFLGSQQVRDLAANSPKINQPLLYKIMYIRVTQPIMNIVILLIGIPFLLTREPNRLIKNTFYCIAVCGFVFGATFVIFQMAGTSLPGGRQFDPLLAAWTPVLLFGPVAVVMLDLIKT